MDSPNIELHIDRLILDGIAISNAQRPLLQAAMEAELGRLMRSGGIGAGLSAGGAVPSVVAPAIQLSADGSPVQWGQQIARSVYGGMGA
jgi:hypothetical protein